MANQDVTDYLLQGSGREDGLLGSKSIGSIDYKPKTGYWVRFKSNTLGTYYTANAVTDSTGIFIINAVPTNDDYSVQISQTNPLPAGVDWTTIYRNYVSLSVGAVSSDAALADGSSKGYRPADIVPVDILFSGQTSGAGSLTFGGGGADDTVDIALGTRSRSITTNGAGAQATISATFGAALNLTGKCLVVWMKRTNLSSWLTGYPRLFLGDAGLTNVYFWKLAGGSIQPYEMDGEWIRLTLPFGTAFTTGAPSRASLAALTIQVFDNSTGPVTFKLGGLMTMAEAAQWPNGVVSLTFDDGYLSQYTTARPYLDKYGYRGTAYVITETLWNHANFPGYFSLAQAQQLELGGWEIATHAYTAANHNAGYVSIGDTAALSDMQSGKAYLLQQGFKAPEQFSYPLGAFQAGTITNVARIFGTGRTISLTGSFPDETFPPANLTRLKAYPVSAASGIALAQTYITQAAANKEWLILLIHDVLTSASGSLQLSTANFQTLIDSLNSAGLPVRPISEVLKSG